MSRVRRFSAPSNCGFDVIGGWSAFLASRHAGQPVKPVAIEFEGRRQQGEFVLTATGIEGSLVYAFSGCLREAIARDGSATLTLDLLPQTAPLPWDDLMHHATYRQALERLP